MALIEIDNSYSRVTGLTGEQEKRLRNLLSYVVGGSSSFYSRFGPRKKCLLSKKGEFPTGLLERVLEDLRIAPKDTKHTKIDKRKIPSKSKPLEIHTKLIPHKAQILAVKAALSNHRGIIAMATGSGKSLVIALIAGRLNVKTLVVVPTLEIKRQLTASLLDVLKANHKIVVENIDSAYLNDHGDFDCLIIDEAHHAASKTYQKLNKNVWRNIYYRYFLTATPYRNDSEETLLFESIAGQLIYNLSIKEAISNRYIVPIEAYYYDLPKVETDAYTWAQVYSTLVVNNSNRNKIISNLLKILSNAEISTLCLVKEIEHGHILSDLTGIQFANGKDDVYRDLIRLFNNGKIKSLIGTIGILGEGVDTKPAEYVIIAGLGKAKSAFLQQIGRGVRNYPGKETCKIVLFRDKSHKFTLRHYNKQSKILKEELGISLVKLEDL